MEYEFQAVVAHDPRSRQTRDIVKRRFEVTPTQFLEHIGMDVVGVTVARDEGREGCRLGVADVDDRPARGEIRGQL